MVETLIVSSALFIGCLSAETIILGNHRRKIPLRIAVTGTRGKSTLVRMLAAVLNEAGHAVAAKTTGSQTQLLLPGSGWQEFRRRGLPSIIEQKKVVRLAAQHHSQALVCEIMSIQRENHSIEAQKILQPQVLVITDIGIDHTEAMGQSRQQVAEVLAETITPQAQVFIPQAELVDEMAAAITSRKGVLNVIPTGLANSSKALTKDQRDNFFPQLLDLVLALASYLKIDKKSVAEGLAKVCLDQGAFKIWTCRDKSIYLVNGFAANEPQSTSTLLKKACQKAGAEVKEIVAILTLRPDRGDRTLQWLQDLKTSRWDCLSKIYTVGPQGTILKRKLPERDIVPIKSKDAGKIMEAVIKDSPQASMIMGMGNFKGSGSRLVDLWQREGVEFGH